MEVSCALECSTRGEEVYCLTPRLCLTANADGLLLGYIVPASLVSSFRTMRSPGFLALFKKLYHAVRILYWVVPFHRRNSDQAVQDRLVHFLDGVHGEQPNMPLGIAGM